MRLLNRKSKLQRLVETVAESLDVPTAIRFGQSSGTRFGLPSGIKSLPGVGSRHAIRAGLPQGNALKAGVVAGGLAGLAAGSAGISSLRRRNEEARDDS